MLTTQNVKVDQKYFEDEKMQVLLIKHNTQAQQELAKLNVDQFVANRYLYGMEMVQKFGNLISCKLRKRQMEYQKSNVKCFLKKTK